MTRPRRHFTPEQKGALLREHLLDKVPASDAWEKHGLTVSHFYRWRKLFLEHGHAAFTANDKRRQAATDALHRQIAELQAKLQRKHEALSELPEEHVRLKKDLGEL